MDSSIIKGYVDCSTIDWDGRTAAVIFTGGCNLRCRYCHNASLVLGHDMLQPISYDLVKNKINNNKPFINGIVITGGEPTIHGFDLTSLLMDLKKDTGLPVKLDTNGTQPALLGEILEAELVDYVALDIKTSLTEQLTAITQVAHMGPLVAGSIENIRYYFPHAQYEFRTTVLPCYHSKQHLINMAKIMFEPGEKWKLQNFRGTEDMIVPQMKSVTPYTDMFITEVQEEINYILRERTDA